ncbi:hypothetical protein E3T26_08600 [Cryobacterium sp. TMT1-21]|uniref:C1q-like domain-containing protein n=1 Tax=Cryobacterium sp. TMT1-21 TaxID=1259234 RepID=UPI00106B69B2|nr:hypothetical protein [Cryobacterium sp. TMT1-21]TFD14173.1 hypothetical protein E3T26_08600 [Cryobacterium sp. TMT1-21]
MFNDFKVANYSKALLSPELYARHLSRLFSGDVADGLTVTPGTGLQVVLAPGNAMVRYGSANVASARLVSLVASFNLAIGTADVSNPRIDLVVVYVDNAVSLPSGVPTTLNLDGLGVAKAKIVPGTAAASPVAANATAIQTSVGAGNPYTVVAQVRVDAGVSVIASNKITDVRALATPNLPAASIPVSKLDLTTMPSFRAYLTANQASASGAIVSLASKDYDNVNAFNTTTFRFVAPYAGVYHFSWNVHSTSGSDILSGIVKNGVSVARGAWVKGNTFVASSGSTDLNLAANDYIQLQCLALAGTATLDGGSVFTYLSGHLVAKV